MTCTSLQIGRRQRYGRKTIGGARSAEGERCERDARSNAGFAGDNVGREWMLRTRGKDSVTLVTGGTEFVFGRVVFHGDRPLNRLKVTNEMPGPNRRTNGFLVLQNRINDKKLSPTEINST